MRPEEIGKSIEEALSRIVPVDEVQRERLEKLMEKLAEAGRELAGDLAKIKEQADRAFLPAERGSEEEVLKRGRIAEEISSALAAGFEEQAELIDRIVAERRR